MENENNDKLKEMINNLVCISKEKDLEIMDLKEKLKRERYNKRFDKKKYKLIEYENMVLMNKIKSINEKTNMDKDTFYVSFP
tara:strand:- start:379 stop:624 length:246 start_codon:yes stop_codon:yes gene_type:complete